MNQDKTFRLFVSSIFSDFSVERRLLQKYVFPEIKKYCNESGLNFQPIDLRWGVSNEAQLDQKTLELCLEEVRASKINPHPNFLIMAGDRYGWIPLPYLIEKSEYETIITNIEKEEDKELLNSWYKLDENQIPASYILSERKNEFLEYLNWEKVENQLRDILQNSVNKSSLSKENKEKYFMSATEHEVIEGIFKYLNITPSQEIILQKNKAFLEIDSKHVYAYIRHIKSIDELFKKNFIDSDLKNVYKFKKGIKESIENNNILEVDIELENISKDNINGSLLYSYETIKNEKESNFVKIMIYNLKKSIDSYKNTIKDLSKDEIEALEQKSFKELKIKNFLGREEALQTIDKYLNDNNNEALVVYGKSGLGKSSLMAKAIDNAQNKYLNKKIVYRFVGSTVNLTTTLEILISILKELGINEEIRKIKNSKTLQEENEKIEDFYYRVYNHLKSIKEDTVIFIDAVDQLINEDEFLWLPKGLPNNLKIVISALNDDNYKEDSKYFEDIKNRTKNIYELQIFDLNNAKELVVNLLAKHNRTISKEQMNYLLDIYKNINSPLYLVVASQDLKDWKSTDKNQTLAKTQKFAIISFIDNLSNIHHHNKEFVKRVFAYLSLTGGLSESELLELLSSDKEFLNKIAPETFHTNTTKELPIVIWSRLHTQIKEFIKLENIDNQNVMKFFHREFDNVSKLTQDEHEHLVELLQNLMFKYQDEYFYSNRWGKLYLEVLKKYHLEYEFDYLLTQDSKLYNYCKEVVKKIEIENYLKDLLDILTVTGNKSTEENKSIVSFYYIKSYYYVSKLLYENNSTLWDEYYFEGLDFIGNFLISIERVTDGKKILLYAYNLVKDIYSINENQWIDKYLKSLNSLALAFNAFGEKIEAISLLEEGIIVAEKFIIKCPEKGSLLYLTILNNLAKSLNDFGETSKSIEFYYKYFSFVNKLYSENPKKWIEKYMLGLNNLSVALSNVGEVEEAINILEENLDLLKNLYKEEPQKWFEYYLKCLNNLAFFKNNESSISYYNEAIFILRNLYNENKDRWAIEYGNMLFNLSSFLEERGEIIECIDLLKESVSILKEFHNIDPDRWTLDYTTRLFILSFYFQEIWKYEEAIELLKESLKVLKPLSNSSKYLEIYDMCLNSLTSNLEEINKTELEIAEIIKEYKND